MQRFARRSRKGIQRLIFNTRLRAIFAFLIGTVLVGILVNNLSEDVQIFRLENLKSIGAFLVQTVRRFVLPNSLWIALTAILVSIGLLFVKKRRPRFSSDLHEALIGRQSEIDLIQRVLSDKHSRCLCIWGLPGTGKTTLLRLTIELALQLDYDIIGWERREVVHVPFTGESCVSLLTRATGVRELSETPHISSLHEFLSGIRHRSLLAIDEFPAYDSSFVTTFNDYVRQIIALDLPIIIVVASTVKCALPLGKQAYYIWEDRGLGGFDRREAEIFIKREVPDLQEAQIDRLFNWTGGNPKQLDLLLSQPNIDVISRAESHVRLKVPDLAIKPAKQNQFLFNILSQCAALSFLLPEWPIELGKQVVQEFELYADELNLLGYLEQSDYGRAKVPEMIRDYLLGELDKEAFEGVFGNIAARLCLLEASATKLSATELTGLILEALYYSRQPRLLIHTINEYKDSLISLGLENTVWRMLYDGCESEIDDMVERADFLFFCVYD